MKRITVVMLSILLMCSCSSRFASNGEKQYLTSRNGPNIVVPSPLTSANISHFYDLPNQDKPAEVSITPPSNPS